MTCSRFIILKSWPLLRAVAFMFHLCHSKWSKHIGKTFDQEHQTSKFHLNIGTKQQNMETNNSWPHASHLNNDTLFLIPAFFYHIYMPFFVVCHTLPSQFEDLIAKLYVGRHALFASHSAFLPRPHPAVFFSVFRGEVSTARTEENGRTMVR